MTVGEGLTIDVPPEWSVNLRCPKGHPMRFMNGDKVWAPAMIHGQTVCVVCIAEQACLRCTRPHLVAFSVDDSE